MKKCPYCAEEIQDEAIICRYCYHDITKPVSEKINQGHESYVENSKVNIPKVRIKNLFWSSFWFGIGMGCLLVSFRLSQPQWNLNDVIFSGISNVIIYGLVFFIVVKLWRFFYKKIRKGK